jgi:putative methyltransferase (TIGR04325 family)
VKFGRFFHPSTEPEGHGSQGKEGPEGYIWEGIYEHYRDVPASGPGFNGERWVKDSFDLVNELVRTRRQEQSNSRPSPGEGEKLLSLLCSLTLRDKGEVKVLDFGGGSGAGYVYLADMLPDATRLQYHIVETTAMCRAGEEFFQGETNIQFFDSLPPDGSHFDIVYINSALQYVEDYAGLIHQLCAYDPSFFLFVRLSAGKIPTFATAQRNVEGSVLPYWFLNIDELVQVFRKEGYSPLLQCTSKVSYDQSNLPLECRLNEIMDMLLGRRSEDKSDR